MSTSPPAAYLRSQRSSSPFSVAIARRISTTSAATAAAIARAAQHVADHRLDLRGKRRRARDHARARQRHVLPGPGLVLLIAREGIDLGRERPGAAGRPQPHVDLVERAVVGLRRQRADQPLRQPGEILRAVERARAVRFRLRGVEIVDDDQIEIGGRRHLAAAELAEREDRGLLAAHTAVRLRRTSPRPRRCSARITTSASRAKASPACSADTVPDRMRAPIRNMCSWPNMRRRSRKSS